MLALNIKLFNRLGFSDDDFIKSPMLFPNNEHLTQKLGDVFYFGKSKEVNTRFYWINLLSDDITQSDEKSIHERIWNENKSELLFLEKEDSIKIKYVSTSPKENLIDISSISKNLSDEELLEKISKEHITTGSFWIKYSSVLSQINKKKKRVNIALIESLRELRSNLNRIYGENKNDIVQSLIDRTLFIKFLEDKGIINSAFYKKYFDNPDIHYKDLLENGKPQNINKLFSQINEIFNNTLFDTPAMQDDDLPNEALSKIAASLNANIKQNQLSLFDFQFDIIPIEFISHIYQIFLDDKKLEQGIVYTPEPLADLTIKKVITDDKVGKVLDPSCGSGIFLVLAFRKMYKSQKLPTYEEIQHRLEFVKNNIFGIEIENAAVRLSKFSLYLEVLKDIAPSELKQIVTDIIETKSPEKLFSIDFSENIQEKNALLEGKEGAFYNKKFDYIIGNPPWFILKNNSDPVDLSYRNKYKDDLGNQISQCFLRRINKWSNNNTRYGFIVNSSNFSNDFKKFQKFFLKKYRIDKYFELHHIKNILFDNAKESASLLIFDNNMDDSNEIKYYLPKLNDFSKIFRTILLKEDDIVQIKQNDLFEQKVKLRDFLIGNTKELELANKLEQENTRIENIALSILNGGKFWGKKACKKEFNIDAKHLDADNYNHYKQIFQTKYFSNKPTEKHIIPVASLSTSNKFEIEKNTYCLEDISNFEAPRNISIYEGAKIICNRLGKNISAAFTDEKVYFNTDLYVLKLNDPSLYHVITCCLNSDLINYYCRIKFIKRIDSNRTKLHSDDLKKIPIPKEFNPIYVEQLTELSNGISNKTYTFEEKKDELNDLVYDLYGLTYYERQRIKDFFIKDKELTKSILEKYCNVFLSIFSKYYQGNISFEYYYKLPFIAGVKIIFGNDDITTTEIKKVALLSEFQLLEQIKNKFVLISLNERIQSGNSIFIIKDKEPKSWTEIAAFDDVNVEINNFFKS